MGRRVQKADVLRHPVRARLYAALDQADQPRIAELANVVHMRPSSIRWHLGKMKAAGLLVEDDHRGRRYRIASTPEARLATALRILQSVPARELMMQIWRTPGLHLQELADRLAAPRSRYWRVASSLELAGLVKVHLHRRAKLLFATRLAAQCIDLVSKDTAWEETRRRKTRRPRRRVQF